MNLNSPVQTGILLGAILLTTARCQLTSGPMGVTRQAPSSEGECSLNSRPFQCTEIPAWNTPPTGATELSLAQMIAQAAPGAPLAYTVKDIEVQVTTRMCTGPSGKFTALNGSITCQDVEGFSVFSTSFRVPESFTLPAGTITSYREDEFSLGLEQNQVSTRKVAPEEGEGRPTDLALYLAGAPEHRFYLHPDGTLELRIFTTYRQTDDGVTQNTLRVLYATAE